VTIRPSIFDRDILALDVTLVTQSNAKRHNQRLGILWRAVDQSADAGRRWLLRP